MKHLSLTFISRPTFFLSPAALVLAASIFIAASPDAIAMGGGNGNPFSNGTFFPNEGTFQTTIRGVNLSGVATFSTGGSGSSSSTTTPSSGSFTVSHQGISYTGNVDAGIDPVGGTIAATFEASVNRLGSGNSTSVLSSSFELSGNSTLVPGATTPGVTTGGGTASILQTTTVTVDNTDNVPPGGIVITTTTAPVTITLPSTTSGNSTAASTSTPGFYWVDETATSLYLDTLYVSGSFTARLKNSFPNQIFSGKGTMEFTSINFDLAPPALVTTAVNIGVKGVRLSNTAQTFIPKTPQAPSVITTISAVPRSQTTNRRF